MKRLALVLLATFAFAACQEATQPDEADRLGEPLLSFSVPTEFVFLIIDEESIDNGNPPNFFSDVDVNDQIARIGQRAHLDFFAGHDGGRITLHTGEVGDEGWFAPKTIPADWDAAGPTGDGLRNYLAFGPGYPTPGTPGPGLGSGDDSEALLDKIPDVTPLRATGLKLLEGEWVCAVVYDSDVSINYDPLEGSLKGANLGTVAFAVLSVTKLDGFSSSSLPQVTIRILRIGQACRAGLTLFQDAPEPISSSDPFDVDPALTNPSDVEALIGGAAATWWDALHNIGPFFPDDAGWPAILTTMADESSLSWSNWGIRAMSSEPRVAWPNSSTFQYENTVRYPYQTLYGALSAVRDGIVAINAGLVIEDAARTQRALAFAKLIQGLSHGYLAVFWDQANILNEDTDLSQELPFGSYTEMMAEAIANLEASIAISDATTFTTPSTWFNGITLTNTELARLAHSFIARFLANNARTAAERDAVDWHLVKTHIAAGITEAFAPVGDEMGGAGPWYDLVKWMQGGHSWSRADYRMIGGVRPNDPETDPDGGYAAWLNLPVNDRVEYHLNTQDKRIQGVAGVDACVDLFEETAPGGCGRISPGAVDPGTDFRYAAGSPFRPDRGTYHFSMYKPTRYDYHLQPDGFGPMVHMTPTEMNLLMAEAHLRLSEAGAAALINLTRVTRGQLSAATDGDADIWEKLYYEKFIEQFNNASGLAFTERRGAPEIAVSSSVPGLTLLGLVPQTPRHFPVPARELEILGLPLYTFGGPSGPDMAPAVAGVRWSAPAAAVYKFNPEWTTAEKLEHLSAMRKGSGLPSYR